MITLTRTLMVGAIAGILGLSFLALGTSASAEETMMSNDKMMSGGEMMMTSPTSYEVSITNIMSGQAITPPLLVTHSGDVHVFSLGEKASEALRQLAENGNVMLLKDTLTNTMGVYATTAGSAPLVPASAAHLVEFGYTMTYTISADYNHQYLSFASMLICTNDGFAGLDAVKLPLSEEGAKTYYAVAYDAGTERNTEAYEDLVPPCGALTDAFMGESMMMMTDDDSMMMDDTMKMDDSMMMNDTMKGDTMMDDSMMMNDTMKMDDSMMMNDTMKGDTMMSDSMMESSKMSSMMAMMTNMAMGGTDMTDLGILEFGIIIPHQGISGMSGDLSFFHSWTDPVVKVVITPIP